MALEAVGSNPITHPIFPLKIYDCRAADRVASLPAINDSESNWDVIGNVLEYLQRASPIWS